MEQAAAGLQKAMRERWAAAPFAEVLEGGPIAVGDAGELGRRRLVRELSTSACPQPGGRGMIERERAVALVGELERVEIGAHQPFARVCMRIQQRNARFCARAPGPGPCRGDAHRLR